ncbi:RTA1 like protein-domain-containing protein [Echria macrotheca]|uniref:RTA1 like protein-domain-containing protein n=1 Tax=Echria macrotheca TaxID=438768 RepID=A0AAJ0FA76_9PEZI|nr:RTA1 like protein-domain-containing protein [Echria macrotheca]
METRGRVLCGCCGFVWTPPFCGTAGRWPRLVVGCFTRNGERFCCIKQGSLPFSPLTSLHCLSSCSSSIALVLTFSFSILCWSSSLASGSGFLSVNMASDLQQFKYYHYNPSYGGNIAFIVLFSIPTIIHIVLMFRRKTWYFIPFVIGCLFEVTGYIGRVISAQETPNWTLGPYLVQTLLILLAPALYAASIYMVLGRLIQLLDAEEHSVVRLRWLTKVFVLGDVLSFLGQSAGGGILATAKTKKDQDLGNDVVLSGLGIQVIFFGLFIITTAIFHRRITSRPTARSFAVAVPWQRFLLALYASSILILARSLFRMVEFGLGSDSVLMQQEVFLFVLDGLLMLGVTLVFIWYHPGRILLGYKSVVGVSRDGDVESSAGENFRMVSSMEVTGGGRDDKRRHGRRDERERREKRERRREGRDHHRSHR